MYKALVYCVAGMGSSMLLKIKASQVIQANAFPIELEHGDIETLDDFEGDLVITMKNLEPELASRYPYVIGIEKVMDTNEMKEKLEAFLKVNA